MVGIQTDTGTKTVWRFLKILGIKPHDPVIPLLSIYSEQTKMERHMYLSVQTVKNILTAMQKTWV